MGLKGQPDSGESVNSYNLIFRWYRQEPNWLFSIFWLFLFPPEKRICSDFFIKQHNNHCNMFTFSIITQQVRALPAFIPTSP